MKHVAADMSFFFFYHNIPLWKCQWVRNAFEMAFRPSESKHPSETNTN